MKTTFTLLASLFLTASVFAADTKPSTVLAIQSIERGDIRVVVDGRRFEPNTNQFRISGINAGYHSVKIYRERNTGLFTIFGKRYEVVYNGSVSIKPRTSMTMVVDRFGRTTMSEMRSGGWKGGRGYDNNNRSYGDKDDSGWDNGRDLDFDREGQLGDYGNDRGNNQYGNGKDRNDDRNYHDNTYNRAMSDYEFTSILRSIDKEWFENNKMKSASQIISTNFLTTYQVKQLLQLFTFETNKLELAKQAYTKTIDQKNYFMINEVFSFNSSKDELARFIRSCE